MKRRKNSLADALVTEERLKADIAYLEGRIEKLQAAGGQQYVPGLRRTISLVTAMVAYVHKAGRPVTFMEAALSAREEIEATT